MIALVIVAVVCVAAILAAHFYAVRSIHDEHVAGLRAFQIAADTRDQALYKQQKAHSREATKTAARTVETVRNLHADAQLMHQRTDALARDVKSSGR